MVIMGRDSTGQTIKIGEVRRDNGDITFDVPNNLREMLQSFRFAGQEYTPESPEFFDILPYYLHGDRLWAVPE